MAVFLVSLDASVVIAAFPALRESFGSVSAATLSWSLNAYTIVYAALLIPAGRLADLHGHRRIFVAGVLLFAAASGACGMAASAEQLIAARAVQAVGAALLTPASLALVLRAFPAERRVAIVGLWSAVGALAAAIGPSAGSWIIDHASWRWVFLINVPLGLLAAGLAMRRIAESSATESGARPDLPGIALLIAGVALIAGGIVAHEAGYTMAQALGLGIAGAAALAVFARWARGRSNAALDLSLFEDRSLRWASAASLVFGAGFSAMFLAAFLFLMGIWGWSQSLTGLALTPGPLMVIPIAVLSSRWERIVGRQALLVMGGLIFAASHGLLAGYASREAHYLTLWLPSQILTGVAIGLVLPALSAAIVAGLPTQRFGVGSGVSNALRQLGGSLGTAVAVALIGSADAPIEAYRALFAVIAACGLAVALMALAMGRPVTPTVPAARLR
jgi:EmrB/QacA subfamily drug resistance transporter